MIVTFERTNDGYFIKYRFNSNLTTKMLFEVDSTLSMAFILLWSAQITSATNIQEFNLPETHMKYFFNSFPWIADECRKDLNCPYKISMNDSSCWGYESNCEIKNAFFVPKCSGDHKGWVSTKESQLQTFFNQADFGYIKKQRQELDTFCTASHIDDSALECSHHMRFCRGRNILINLTSLENRSDQLRYKMDILHTGDISGHCKLNARLLLKNADHISPLQSWGPEIRNFVELQQKVTSGSNCDVFISKPTFILKIDAAVNMYHHFCDFFNLYASLHVNSDASTFTTDNHILIWESYSYYSAFQDTFKAFSKHALWNLNHFRGKVICFKNVVFPLLPRMIFGLYYNTPLIYGCEKSGLFKSFSEFILHRLSIPLHKPSSKIRITFLSRDTQYRRVINEDELIKVLQMDYSYVVKKVIYNKKIPFRKQLEITRNTDVFIGIHGAGLTHFLFLPDWAVGFELYNCGDVTCYRDLARLRGIKYLTWENPDKVTRYDSETHPREGAHEKFINYAFDVYDFKRIVSSAAEFVKNHLEYRKFSSHLHKEEL